MNYNELSWSSPKYKKDVYLQIRWIIFVSNANLFAILALNYKFLVNVNFWSNLKVIWK